jgi:hypothetical protein
MNHLYPLRSLGLFCAALFLAQLSPAHAYSEQDLSTASSEFAYDSFSPNLLTGLTPSGPAPDFVNGFTFTINGINDGTADGPPGNNDVYYDGSAPFSSSHTLSSDPTVTFTFAAPVSIGSIVSIFGWDDNQSFSDQNYTITYTLATDLPTQLPHSLGSVANDPFDPANDVSGGVQDASKVTLSNIDLTDVSSLSFQFIPYDSPTNGKEQGAALIRNSKSSPSPSPPLGRCWSPA